MSSKRREGRRSRWPDLAFVILGYVEMHPDGIHAYQLWRSLSSPAMGLPSLRRAGLYRILHQLEQHGFLQGRREVGGSRPPRHRFKVTQQGAAAFARWLASGPHQASPVRAQLLDRLRFAHRFPRTALTILLHQAVRECEAELDAIGCSHDAPFDPHIGGRAIVSMVIRVRLAAELEWLGKIVRLLDTCPVGGTTLGTIDREEANELEEISLPHVSRHAAHGADVSANPLTPGRDHREGGS